MTKFIKLSNAQDGTLHIDPDFIGMISRNRDSDTFLRFKDGSYAHVLELPDEIVKMIEPLEKVNFYGMTEAEVAAYNNARYTQLSGRFDRLTGAAL